MSDDQISRLLFRCSEAVVGKVWNRSTSIGKGHALWVSAMRLHMRNADWSRTNLSSNQIAGHAGDGRILPQIVLSWMKHSFVKPCISENCSFWSRLMVEDCSTTYHCNCTVHPRLDTMDNDKPRSRSARKHFNRIQFTTIYNHHGIMEVVGCTIQTIESSSHDDLEQVDRQHDHGLAVQL